MKLIWRPLTPRLPSGPFRELMYAKYAFIAGAIGAYADAGPDSGNVPPTTIFEAVIPVSAGRPRAPGIPTASATIRATEGTMSFRTDLLLLLTEWPACRRERNSALAAPPLIAGPAAATSRCRSRSRPL